MKDLVANSIQNETIPREFVWPEKDLPGFTDEELKEPVVDLQGFFNGDWEATQRAAMLVRSSCSSYGFFQVINHGVDQSLIEAVHREAKHFFKLPTPEKQKGRPLPGTKWGFSAAHSERYSAQLPWKEMLSFKFHENGKKGAVVEFFESLFGEGYEQTGLVFQRYCEALWKLSGSILEVIGISLGIDKSNLREFYEDGSATMRANYYPSCPEPGLTLGTGPHCDPTSITILHQDEAGGLGLQVFVDKKWKQVRPRRDAFVINIGDTFMALTNGKYKSCLHRAVVSKEVDRISLTYFVNPKDDKVIKPPEQMLSAGNGNEEDEPRKYPNFTWLDLFSYTQNHYRADGATLQNFSNWTISSSD